MVARFMGLFVFGVLALVAMGEELSTEARARALMTVEVRPAAYVFTGEAFPQFDFDDPALGERLLGRYAVSVRFYDGKWREVRTPGAPGRYGAVIDVVGEEGATLKRFRTIFRAGEGYDAKLQAYWGVTRGLYFGKDTGLEVPRDAWTRWPADGHRFKIAEAQYSTRDGQDLAILAAGAADLSEDPWVADRQWWVTLKRKMAGVATEVAVPASDGTEATTLREGSEAEARMAPGAVEKIDALLTSWASDSGEPFSVALARRGVVFLHKAYGTRDAAPLAEDTPCWMASISKLMSSTLMWMLVDRGLVSLDDPIEKYLPALQGHAGERSLMVRDLYTHTNGLHLDITLPGHYPDHWGDEMHDLDEALAGYYEFLKVGPDPTYNGVGYAVGGKIVEMVSGKALPAFYRRHLLEPMGMTNTLVQDGSAATRSVAMDMARLGQMLLNKGAYGAKRYFSEETFAKMLPKRLTESLGEDTKAVWGIGITPMAAEGLSASTFGHGAASSAIFRIDPEQDLVIVQCRDTAGPGYGEFSAKFFKLLGESVLK